MDVVTGLSNNNYVEIKSGLSVGDTVWYTESTSVMDMFGNMGGGRGGFGGEASGNFGGGEMPDMGGQMPDMSGGEMPQMPQGGGRG